MNIPDTEVGRSEAGEQICQGPTGSVVNTVSFARHPPLQLVPSVVYFLAPVTLKHQIVVATGIDCLDSNPPRPAIGLNHGTRQVQHNARQIAGLTGILVPRISARRRVPLLDGSERSVLAAGPGQHDSYRAQNDLQVQPNAPVLNVGKVK